MLELIGVAQKLPRKGQEPLKVLNDIALLAPENHVLGIIGPTLSGKTSLIRILAGITSPSQGNVLWKGSDTRKHPLHPNQIGYVPAGDNAIPAELTARENIISALLLRVEGISTSAARKRADQLLSLTGIETLGSRRYDSLSLAQRRRLQMAVALVSDPSVVICDGFTDRLDARSSRELGALLREVAADHPARLVIHATDDLSNIDSHDSVLLLHEGNACYHGPVRAIVHYFSIKTPHELFPRLAQRPGTRWGESWSRHRDSYYKAFKLGGDHKKLASASENDETADPDRVRLPSAPSDDEQTAADSTGSGTSGAPETGAVTTSTVAGVPPVMAQVRHLLRRRWTLFQRRRHEWILALVLILGSPLLVSLFFWPNAQALKDAATATPGSETLWVAAFTCLTGVFVQTLLALFGAIRFASREIAFDRAVFERERVGGLPSLSHVLARLGFVLPLSMIQCLSLGILVETAVSGLPGHAFARLVLLILSGIAFSFLCLGISANSSSKERAYGLSLLLLFGNVILAGAMLAPSRILGGVIQPFSTAYYGWSGAIDTMTGSPVFEPMTRFVPTWFATPAFAVIMLIVHALVGLTLIIFGMRRGRA